MQAYGTSIEGETGRHGHGGPVSVLHISTTLNRILHAVDGVIFNEINSERCV